MSTCLYCQAYQKYYSALDNLSRFCATDDFFDGVACLDVFFSEFRNVTFMLQKTMHSAEHKIIYENTRDQYLVGDDIKWLRDKRNQVTKETPIGLEKELHVRIFDDHKGRVVIKKEYSVGSWGENDTMERDIKDGLMKYGDAPEVYLTLELIFKEGGTNVEIFPRIMSGIDKTRRFLDALEKQLPINDECATCSVLRDKATKMAKEIPLRQEFFSCRDCIFVPKKDSFIYASRAALIFENKNGKRAQLGDIRAKLEDSPIFSDITDDEKIFSEFIKSHILMYKMQNFEFMPVFFLLYDDGTFTMIPFLSTLKTTLYRVIDDISKAIKRDGIRAVIYAGEFYCYKSESDSEFEEFLNKDSASRAAVSMSTSLVFSFMSNSKEVTLFFDQDRIADDEYVAEEVGNNDAAEMCLFKSILEQLR